MLETKITRTLPPETQALRRKVFMEEQGFTYEFDETDHTAYHLTLYEDGTAVGCCRFFPDEGTAWHIGRVAVSRDCRGRGLGAAVMREAEKAILSLGGGRAVLSAQEQAKGFYASLGYVQKGESYLDEHCPHVDMEKDLRKEGGEVCTSST